MSDARDYETADLNAELAAAVGRMSAEEIRDFEASLRIAGEQLKEMIWPTVPSEAECGAIQERAFPAANRADWQDGR